MHNRSRRQRGFSLTETLTVVAILGLVALVTVPAMVQLMPQYRIRSASSEAAAALRMIRQKAITTRTPWMVSFDAANERYAYYRLSAPNAARNTTTNWINVGRDTRENPTPGSTQWIRTSAVDLQTGSINPNQFKNVDGDSGGTADIVFLRDGSVANDPAASGGGNLTFSTNPSIVFAVNNSFVRFNRYFIELQQNGTIAMRALKQ